MRYILALVTLTVAISVGIYTYQSWTHVETNVQSQAVTINHAPHLDEATRAFADHAAGSGVTFTQPKGRVLPLAR